jgi:hypothetical protein
MAEPYKLTSSQFGETISTPKEKNPMKPDHSFRYLGVVVLGVGGVLFVLGVVAAIIIGGQDKFPRNHSHRVGRPSQGARAPLPLYVPRDFLVDLQSGGVIIGPMLGERYELEEECQATLAATAPDIMLGYDPAKVGLIGDCVPFGMDS